MRDLTLSELRCLNEAYSSMYRKADRRYGNHSYDSLNLQSKLSESVVTSELAYKLYDKFNSWYFGNNLPRIPIVFKTIRSRSFLGKLMGFNGKIPCGQAIIAFMTIPVILNDFKPIRCVMKKASSFIGRTFGRKYERLFSRLFINGGLPIAIHINTHYNFTERGFAETLLHEMIHVYESVCFSKNILKDGYDCHGEWFKSQCRRMCSYGWRYVLHANVKKRVYEADDGIADEIEPMSSENGENDSVDTTEFEAGSVGCLLSSLESTGAEYEVERIDGNRLIISIA